jgi:hypothetical protein
MPQGLELGANAYSDATIAATRDTKAGSSQLWRLRMILLCERIAMCDLTAIRLKIAGYSRNLIRLLATDFGVDSFTNHSFIADSTAEFCRLILRSARGRNAGESSSMGCWQAQALTETSRFVK